MTKLTGRRVLVVEDEEIIAMALEDVLIEMGCTVIGPVSGIADAVARIREETIDAAIVDLNIVGGQSYTVAEALLDIGVPFLFCTGCEPDGIDRDYAGSVILQKPFMPRDVVIGLQQILGLSGQNDPPGGR